MSVDALCLGFRSLRRLGPWLLFLFSSFLFEFIFLFSIIFILNNALLPTLEKDSSEK